MAEFLPNGFALGLQAGQFNRRQRLDEQEFESKEAERRIRERLLAQQIQDLQRKAQLSEEQLAAYKDAAAGYARDLQEQDFIQLGENVQGPLQQNPNKIDPLDAAVRNFGPAVAQSDPGKLMQLLSGAELAKQRRAMAGLSEARSNQVDKGKPVSLTAVERNAKALASAQKAYDEALQGDDQEAIEDSAITLRALQAFAPHVADEDSKRIQTQVVNGQTYLFKGNSAPRLVTNPAQKARFAIAQKSIEDIDQQMRDLELSRKKPEEKAARMEVLRLQREQAEKIFDEEQTPAPAAIESPVPASGMISTDSPAASAGPGSAAAPIPVVPPRPPGISDAELLRQARQKKKEGTDPAWLMQRLKAWGVKGDL